jgi:hypothetical protein
MFISPASAAVMNNCENWLNEIQDKVFSVGRENFGHVKLVTNVPIGSRTISVQSGSLNVKVILYCPSVVVISEPDVLVIPRRDDGPSDEEIYKLLDTAFRKRV